MIWGKNGSHIATIVYQVPKIQKPTNILNNNGVQGRLAIPDLYQYKSRFCHDDDFPSPMEV